MQKTSFVRKATPKAASNEAAAAAARADAAAAAPASSLPAGSKISPHTSQLIISTGLADLDEIIGGGFSVGTLAIIEEDIYSTFNQYLLRYFVVEGICCNQRLYVASSDGDTSALLKSLPHISTSQAHLSPSSSSAPEDKDMKIAWQYKKYLGDDSEGLSPSKTAPWCHSFDTNRNIESSKLDTARIQKQQANVASLASFSAKLHSVYSDVNEIVNAMNTELSKGGASPEILRIGIPSLGAPFWGAEGNQTAKETAFIQFLHAMKGLLRASTATCLITVPTQLFSPLFINKLRHYCDYVFSMASFSDSSDPVNAAFAEHDGFFVVRKMPRINTLSTQKTEQITYTFKMKRHKLAIESIHLGPEVSRTTAKPSGGHDSDHKHDHHGHSHSSTREKGPGMLCQPGPPSKKDPLDF